MCQGCKNCEGHGKPDLTNDTEKVKELYGMVVKLKELYGALSPAEQERMDQLTEHCTD